MTEIKLEDRVFLGGRKGAYRVVGFGHLHGEKAVALINNSDIGNYRRWRKLQQMTKNFELDHLEFFTIVRRVPVEDLVRDTKRRGWRERWRQEELAL